MGATVEEVFMKLKFLTAAACILMLLFTIPQFINRPGSAPAVSAANKFSYDGPRLTLCVLPFAPLKPEHGKLADMVSSDLARQLADMPKIKAIASSEVQKILPGLRTSRDYRPEMRGKLVDAFKPDFIIGGEVGLDENGNQTGGFVIRSGRTGKTLLRIDQVKFYGAGGTTAGDDYIRRTVLENFMMLTKQIGMKIPAAQTTVLIKQWENELGGVKARRGFQYPGVDRAGTLLVVEKGSPSLPYYLHIPPNYDTTGWSYPLLVFLHGTSARSDTLSPKLITHSPLAGITRMKSGMFSYDETALKSLNQYLKGSFVLMPQLELKGDPSWKPEQINKLVSHIIKKYPVNINRVYVMGISRGGAGAWSYANQLYTKIAAVVPICGYNDGWGWLSGRTRLIDMPTWCFHAFDDTVVPIDGDSDVIEGILPGDLLPNDQSIWPGYPHRNGDSTKAAPFDCTISAVKGKPGEWKQGVVYPGGMLTFTVFPTGGHNIMGRVYAIPDLWKWLYSQEKN